MAAPQIVIERIQAVATLDPSALIENLFFSAEPYAFTVHQDCTCTDLVGELAEKLDLPISGLCLIGSGRLGFSLNQSHLLNPFSSSSDLDFVAVSSERFDESWEELTTARARIALSDEAERRRLTKARETLADGYFRPDQLPLVSSLSQDWFPRLAGPFLTPIARRLPIKAWLFKSWPHAQACYERYLSKIQPKVRRLLEIRGNR
jgi:hypothetical protein